MWIVCIYLYQLWLVHSQIMNSAFDSSLEKKKKKASVRWLQLGNWVYATHYRCRWLEVVVKMVWC